MKKTQQGIALVETLLIILTLAIIGFGGYYVWHTQKQTDKANEDTLKSSQSSPVSSTASLTQVQSLDSNKITFSIPSDWMSIPSGQNINGNNCSYSVYANSDYIKCIEGKTLYPSSLGTDSSFTLSASAYLTIPGHTDPQTWYSDFSGTSGVKNDQNDTVSTNKVNNYDAFYWEQRISDSESYTDEHYVISAKNKIVYFVSRVKASHSGGDYDYSKYLPDIKAIVKSVKIN